MRLPDFIIGPSDDPYLERWWVIPRNRWFNIYLHHFLRSDDDRALHDHMYHNVSIILQGSYIEHFSGGASKVRHAWRPWFFWRLAFRKPETAHRIALVDDNPVWTIFLTGPRLRQWFFHCPQGLVHWRAFTDARDSGQIGRGCDQ